MECLARGTPIIFLVVAQPLLADLTALDYVH